MRGRMDPARPLSSAIRSQHRVVSASAGLGRHIGGINGTSTASSVAMSLRRWKCRWACRAPEWPCIVSTVVAGISSDGARGGDGSPPWTPVAGVAASLSSNSAIRSLREIECALNAALGSGRRDLSAGSFDGADLRSIRSANPAVGADFRHRQLILLIPGRPCRTGASFLQRRGRRGRSLRRLWPDRPRRVGANPPLIHCGGGCLLGGKGSSIRATASSTMPCIGVALRLAYRRETSGPDEVPP